MRYAIFSTILFLIISYYCHAQDPEVWLPVRPTDSRISEEAWQRFAMIAVSDYPMKIVRPAANILLVRQARPAVEAFLHEDWKPAEEELPDWFPPGLLMSSNDKMVGISFTIGRNASEQLSREMEEAWFSLSVSARPSTIICFGPDPTFARVKDVPPEMRGFVPVLPVSGASFIANYNSVETAPNNIRYSIANVAVWIYPYYTDPEHRRFPMDSELVKLANRFNRLFRPEEEIEAQDVVTDELLLRLIAKEKDGQSVIEWVAEEEYADYWIRIDSEHGELSISEEEDNRLILAGIPDGGTVVTIYAISPDGKEWFKKSMEIKAFDVD